MTRPGRLCTNVYLSLTCCAGMGGALQPRLRFATLFIYLFSICLSRGADTLNPARRVFARLLPFIFLFFYCPSHLAEQTPFSAVFKRIRAASLEDFAFCLFSFFYLFFYASLRKPEKRRFFYLFFFPPLKSPSSQRRRKICNSHICSVKLP